MEDEWIECRLADACSSIDYGLTASAADMETGPKFLRITDIVSGHIDWKEVPHVVADKATIQKYKLHDEDIVIARTGASTGSSAYIKSPPEAVFASYLVRLRAKPEFDPHFLAYYLKSELFWTYIHGVLGDKSAQPNASASTMTKAPLVAPRDKKYQRAIAQILGALEDKIELNRRTNETLEAVARTIFRSWFVDFDPVRAKANGRDTRLPKGIADLFPNRFEDSELAQIPAGWEVMSLDEIAEFRNGLALQKYPAVEGDEFLYRLKIRELRQGSFDDKSEKSTPDIPEECIVNDGDMVFSWSGSLLIDLWTGGTGALNQHLFKVTSDQYPMWFYFFWTKYYLDEFQGIAEGKATTMGHIKRTHLSEAKVVVPSSKLLGAGSEYIEPLLQSLVSKRLESRTLAHLRDTLLPKLFSGEVRVADTERLFEAAS